MTRLPEKLKNRLEKRHQENSLRTLEPQINLVDFSSNDYLGFSKSEVIFNETHNFLIEHHNIQNGATGSRLLSGNHLLYPIVESLLCEFHQSEAAIVFNSGFDANLGLFASIPQRDDIILYDEFIHASIREGIQLSKAKAYKFKHNDVIHLQHLIERNRESLLHSEIYIVTESVFSMDGDSPDLTAMSAFVEAYGCLLIIDEAHAVGVLGKKGEGLVQNLGIESYVFARLVTFGKALGCHGAAILGSTELKQYLINYARSLIYTTALPPHSIATIITVYKELHQTLSLNKLNQNIRFFKNEIHKNHLQNLFIESSSAIHCCIIPCIENIKSISNQLNKNGFDVKAILSPTVRKGQERLRFCIHSFNSEVEIAQVLKLLATFVK
jgi:8-amino-7-oxononanoate synthase